MHELHEVERRGEFLRRLVELVLAERHDAANFALHLAHVPHGLDDVASTGLALRADHRRALTDAPERLAEVARAADEGNVELVLVDVPHVVRGGKHLGLVDVVDLYRLEDARLGDVSDAALRHHRNRHRRLDALYHRGVAHARDASSRADVGRDALERHHGARARLLGDLRLLWRRHVHDNASLQHLREIPVKFLSVTHCVFLLSHWIVTV